jgi:hypothetical protein
MKIPGFKSEKAPHSPTGEEKTSEMATDFESTPLNWTAEERARLEKRLVRKVDARMLIILVIVYILNC